MNKHVNFARLSAAACAAMILSLPATAQEFPPGLPPETNRPAVRAAISACNSDVQKFCLAVQPGGGRIVRCLAANQERISPECRDGILKARAALGM